MKRRIPFFCLLTLFVLSMYPNVSFSQKNWTWYIESTNIVSGYIDVKIGIKANSAGDEGDLYEFDLEGDLGEALYDFGETGGTDPIIAVFHLIGGWYRSLGDPSGAGTGNDWNLSVRYLEEENYTTVTESGVSVATIRFYIEDSNGTAGVTLGESTHQQTYEWDGAKVLADVTYDNSGGDVSLPVQMTDFTATASQENGVAITWRTESEINCAGFHVWRSESEEGIYQQVTTEIIPGQGNQSTAYEYLFIDNNVENGIVYWYKVEEISTDGESQLYGPISVMGIDPVPDTFSLSSNYPNPFNPATTFKYQIPEDCDVSISIYSILGQEIKSWIYENQTKGYYELEWDGKDFLGRNVPSGIYLLRFQAAEFSEMGRMTIIR